MPSRVRASTFTHNLQFQEAVDDDGGTRGDIGVTFVDCFRKWGSVEALNGRELMAAQQMRVDATYKVTTHADRRINARMRFVWSGRTFNIGPPLGVDNERGMYATFMATEVRG